MGIPLWDEPTLNQKGGVKSSVDGGGIRVPIKALDPPFVLPKNLTSLVDNVRKKREVRKDGPRPLKLAIFRAAPK